MQKKDFEDPKNQVIFCLNEGIAAVKKKINSLITSWQSGAGLYYFEVRLKDFYKKEMNSDEDWTVNGKTEFSAKREGFYDILNTMWDEPEKRYDSTYPKVIRKRYFHYHYRRNPNRNSFETNDWIPFYLGISKDIHKRVNEHIECNQPKYSSMKLSHFFWGFNLKIQFFMIFQFECPYL